MRKIILGMFVLILSLVMVGCGDSLVEDELSKDNAGNSAANNEAANNEVVDNNNAGNEEGNFDAGDTEGFEDLITYLDQMDLEPGEPVEQDPAVAASLGAEKGIILPVADIDVQFFIFDENGEHFNQEQVDQASSDEEITIDIGGGETFEIPFLINGDLGLANFEDHHKKDELVEAFTNY